MNQQAFDMDVEKLPGFFRETSEYSDDEIVWVPRRRVKNPLPFQPAFPGCFVNCFPTEALAIAFGTGEMTDYSYTASFTIGELLDEARKYRADGIAVRDYLDSEWVTVRRIPSGL